MSPAITFNAERRRYSYATLVLLVSGSLCSLCAYGGFDGGVASLVQFQVFIANQQPFRKVRLESSANVNPAFWSHGRWCALVRFLLLIAGLQADFAVHRPQERLILFGEENVLVVDGVQRYICQWHDALVWILCKRFALTRFWGVTNEHFTRFQWICNTLAAGKRSLNYLLVPVQKTISLEMHLSYGIMYLFTLKNILVDNWHSTALFKV